MKKSFRTLLLAILFVIPEPSRPLQTVAANRSYPVFRTDKACACVPTKSTTATIEGVEITSKNLVFQVFRDKQTKRELFRVGIGKTNLKLWHYGISEEGDFNDDGIQDYAWYGGDDTSDEKYVFLSSKGGYRRLDVYKSMQGQWASTFPSIAPEFRQFDAEYSLENIHFVRDSTGLALYAEVVPQGQSKPLPRHLRVASPSFVFSDE